MKEIHILHLLPKLLSLYGEYGNVAILEKTLKDRGHSVTVDCWNSGELTLDEYDFVYIGSGTEDNLLEAVKRLMPYKEAIAASIENGTHWLATGNAMAIFGKNAMDVLPFYSDIDPVRHMGDVFTQEAYGAPLVGYVNTSCVYDGIRDPLFHIHYGTELGNEKGASNEEGIHHCNFYGTQLIGPVLVKNPHFLAHIAGELVGDEIKFDPDSNICRAYTVTLRELQKRAGIST